jgi:hypothetical protein
MAPPAAEPRVYRPGWLAKLSVFVAAALYFVGLYFDAMRGADLALAAFLQLLVPFVFVAPAWFVGLLAYAVARRVPPPRRCRRVADVAFAVVTAAEVLFVLATSRGG